jgi:hypothetical protein
MTNPALADLAPFVGQWRMEVYGATFLPDLDTRVTFDGGATWEHDFNVDYVRPHVGQD